MVLENVLIHTSCSVCVCVVRGHASCWRGGYLFLTSEIFLLITVQHVLQGAMEMEMYGNIWLTGVAVA